VTDDDLEPDNLFYGQLGAGVSAADYLETLAGQYHWTRELLSWWHPLDGSRGFDLLVTPVLAGPPPRIGELVGKQGVARVRALLQFTAQFNVSGQPAVSLPLHWTPDGLPVGVQLVAAYGREDLLVRIAAQLEQAQPWSDRRPPLIDAQG
jgi:amidase